MFEGSPSEVSVTIGEEEFESEVTEVTAEVIFEVIVSIANEEDGDGEAVFGS